MEMPSVSAAIMASAIRVPERSALPVNTDADPFLFMTIDALDVPPPLRQKPMATERPWFRPSGTW